MKKGQVYEGVVEYVDFPNKGIVRVDDEICVVKNALPGQKVSFGVNKLRKGKAEGRLLNVVEKSPAEIDSPCSHFGLCGGCTYISLPYEEQLKIKEMQVKKILDQVLCCQGVPYTFEGIKASPNPYEYRNKMEFSFGDECKDGPLALGMHKRGSFYDIVSVKDCRLVDEDYRKILQAVLSFFAERKIPFCHRMSHEGYLRHLLVRKAVKTGEILIALVTTTQVDFDEESMLADFKDMLLRTDLKGEIAGILHIENDSVADIVSCDRMQTLFGKEYFYEELLGLKFRITPFSFFQTNSLGAEVLYSTAREYIGEIGSKEKDGVPDKIVFDLYSGTGTIAQLMAPVSGKVIGVEIVEEAVEAAKENARLNGLQNCEFIAGDVLKVLDDITEKPDFIILDPPRDGIHPKALPKIGASLRATKMIYISCKPTSLARDLVALQEYGYEVRRACCVDMFPGTYHVETVCELVLKED